MRRTSLNETHRRMGARMIDFGGWEMPVQYSGIVEEHRAVRQRVGLFDVSHMGRIKIDGSEAAALVNRTTTNDVSRLQAGQAQYSAMLYAHGGFVDDILVHKLADDRFFLCVNAANQDKDYGHLLQSRREAHSRFNARIENAGAQYAQLAIQGPCALDTLQKLASVPLAQVRYYWFVDGEVSGARARIARTGYTGEDGFEIYIASEEAPRVWEEILAAGAEFGIKPCGLGARNTLRLEAKMALYGHEIHASVTPWEADLGWIVKLDKSDFIGKQALVRQKERGVARKLTGFEMRDRGIARDGYEVYVDGLPAGWVTSGSFSPTLNKNIGLCYLSTAQARIGCAISILVRGQPVDAVTVPTPFYKRVS